jgi:hypothetical protein
VLGAKILKIPKCWERNMSQCHFISPNGATAPSGAGLPHYRGSPITLPHAVGLLWTSDQPDAETSTWQHKHSQETDIHVPGGIRTRNPSKRMAVDPRAASGIGRCYFTHHKCHMDLNGLETRPPAIRGRWLTASAHGTDHEIRHLHWHLNKFQNVVSD